MCPCRAGSTLSRRPCAAGRFALMAPRAAGLTEMPRGHTHPPTPPAPRQSSSFVFD